MTTYRLPDWLGGHEVDVRGTRGDGQLIVIPRGIVPAGLNPTEIHIDRDELTEVGPPLPPEPPNGTVVLDRSGDAWQRGTDIDDDRSWTGSHGGKCRSICACICHRDQVWDWMDGWRDKDDDDEAEPIDPNAPPIEAVLHALGDVIAPDEPTGRTRCPLCKTLPIGHEGDCEP